MRWLKTIEYRSRVTKVIGEQFHLYAAGVKALSSQLGPIADAKPPTWSDDLAVGRPPG
jgi:hypothetical protein